MNISTENATLSELSFGIFWGVNRLDLFLYSFDLIFGVPTHCYVIWFIFSRSGSVTSSELLNLNLSVCEIGNCLTCFLCILQFFCGLSQLSTATGFLLALAFTGRPQFQSLICVERYLAVVHPVIFLKYKALRYRITISALSWVVILVACLASMLSFISNYVFLYAWFFLMQSLLFFHIQIFCLVAVLRALKRSGPGDRKKKEENHKKRRAFYLILITTLTMCAIYVPLTISGASIILTKHFIKGLFSFAFISYVFAGFVEPALYLQRVGKLPRLCCP